MSKDLNIVVIGGGLAGATTIKKLIKKFRSNSSCSITLIEIQEEIYLNLGSPRSLVDESFTEKCYFKTNSIFKGFPRGKLVIGNVESMDSKTVTVFINGTSSIVPYDYLVIATGRNEEIQADVTLDSTIPPIPNSSFLESFDKNAVNESKYIKVRPTLQIPNHNNLFSLGDVANTGAPKMVVCIDGQASLVATNIFNHYHEKQLKSYQIPAYDTIFIGFGKQKAFGVISGLNNFLIDIVAKQGKCKDLYVGTAGAVYNTK
ncbi:hypothetical protein BC833DRAFT_651044 [Globomyces pollinis-pini]|nr:hypothetical protein BC833DRAFT_651044 [Globomyces pollinis-pini]